jgi:MFS family permease
MSLDLVLLAVSLFTWGIGEGMFIYFQPIYLHQLGANTMTIASLFSAFGVAMMIAHIPAGHLADRIGRKPLLVAAWTTGLLAAWTMALAKTLPVFVVGWLLYGFTAFVSSPLNSYITAGRGKLSPGRAMTLITAAFSLGSVLGPVTGGWIGDHFTLRSVYLVAACIFVPSTGILLFLRPQPPEVHDPDAPPARLFRNQRFLAYLTMAFVAVFAMNVSQPLTPKFLQEERGLSLGDVGLLGSAGSLGNVIFNLLLGQFNTRLGFLLSQVMTALFAVLLWRGDRMVWYAFGYFLLGGYRAARLLIFAQVRSLVHRAQMGLAYGVTEAVNSLAVILAPLLAGAVYTRDPVLVYPVGLGLIGLTLMISLAFAPREVRQRVIIPPPS